MKKILKTCLFLTLVAIGNNSFANNEYEYLGGESKSNCSLSNIRLEKRSSDAGDLLTLKMDDSISVDGPCGLEQTPITIEIYKETSFSSTLAFKGTTKFKESGSKLSIDFLNPSSKCSSDDTCEYSIGLGINNLSASRIHRSDEESERRYEGDGVFKNSSDYDKARIKLECKKSNGCDDNFIFAGSVDVVTKKLHQQDCKITSAEFSPHGDQKNKKEDTLKEGAVVVLKIQTEKCHTSEVETEMITVLPVDTNYFDEKIESAEIKGRVPADGIVTITYQIGSEDCDAKDGKKGYCNTGLLIKNRGVTIFENTKAEDTKSKSKILFECDGLCDVEPNMSWKIISHTFQPNKANYVTEPTKQFINPEGKCINSTGDAYIDNCYEFLAPIPGIGGKDSLGNTEEGVIRDIKSFQLGDYINQLYTVGIGLLAVLAVVMLIAAGVQYMTVESMFGKSHAKSQMTNAALGLLLAMSIYFIIRTINPTLLDVNFGNTFGAATLENNAKVSDTSYFSTIDVDDIPDVEISKMLENDAFVIYIAHQQGYGGASAVVHSVQKGSNKVIESKYTSNPVQIQKNVDNQFSKKPTKLDYFLNFFYKRIIKFETHKARKNIPKEYLDAIKKASLKVGVDYDTMVTMCMVESYLCTKNVDNKKGYRGLFQFGETAWKQYGTGNYLENVFDPYQNSLAAAKMFKDNIKLKKRFK